MKKLFTLLAAALITAQPALAQNAPSGSPRVQGTPDGYGDPVQVTIVAANGADTTFTTTPSVVGNGTAATAARVTIASDSTGQVKLAAGTAAIGSVTATGNVASGAADSGNPVKVGGIYDATNALPALSAGQRGNFLIDSYGNQRAVLIGTNYGAVTDGMTTGAIAYAQASDRGITNPLVLQVAPSVWTGSALQQQRGDTNGVVVQPGLSSTYWSYTSGTTAILSNTTTAVTIKTAAGAGVRNFIDACQIASTALGASVPFAILDGTTVIWAIRPPTAGWTNPIYINFSPPLQSTANALMAVKTTTADTSGTFDVNCQGHTGS